MFSSHFHPGYVSFWEYLLIASMAEVHVNETPLHRAARLGQLQKVKQLLRINGTNINAKINEGFTPLHVAIQNEELPVSVFLIKNGADVNAKDDQEWTPLHNAAYNGFSLKVVKVLIAKGASVNAKADNGKIALHLAAEWNHLEITKFLIQSGADLKATDIRNWTPLHCAAYDGHLEMTKLLLDKGASTDAKTVKCSTPLQFAADHNHSDVVEVLLKSGANVNIADHTKWTALHFAAEKGYDNTVNILLKYKADVNVRDSLDCSTPLHYAAAKGHTHTVKALIANGADMNAKNNLNVTPLLLAARYNRCEVIYTLLQQGAMIDVVHIEEVVAKLDTSFQSSLKTNFTCFLEMVKRFFEQIQNGNYQIVQELKIVRNDNVNAFLAFLNARNSRGQTLIQVALVNKHEDIASALTRALQQTTKTQQSGTNTDNITDLISSCSLSPRS